MIVTATAEPKCWQMGNKPILFIHTQTHLIWYPHYILYVHKLSLNEKKRKKIPIEHPWLSSVLIGDK